MQADQISTGRLITLFAASCQLGFFYETGGELDWHDAGAFAGTRGGREVLLSGTVSVLTSGVILVVVAWFVKNPFYRIAGSFVVAVGYLGAARECCSSVAGTQLTLVAYRQLQRMRRRDEPPREDVEMHSRDSDSDSDSDTMYESDSDDGSDSDDDFSESDTFLGEAEKLFVRPAKRYVRSTPAWTVALFFALWLGVAALVRPERPWNHMTSTIPFSLLAAFKAAPDYCDEQQRLADNEWPLPDLLNQTLWEQPNGYFKGWAPRSDNDLVMAYRNATPDWLPKHVPDGFSRWDPKRFGKTLDSITAPDSETEADDSRRGDAKNCGSAVTLDNAFYNPVDDPLKITNLDEDILEPVKKALDDGSVKIKHVVFVLMESLREELFPIQQGTGIHKFIMDSHEEDEREEINALVSRLTPNIEKITGKAGNFKTRNGTRYPSDEPEWVDQTKPGYGGINVVGGFTPSSVSTKSIAASHCGVWPMPVEMFEEAETMAYQPCLPQILNLFDELKGDKGDDDEGDDWREYGWQPAFFQSVTDTYDRQNMFDTKMGFEQTVARAQIRKKMRGGSIDEVEEINYFGFPETVLQSYIAEYAKEAAENNKRMFLTHFTSTTHHPWKLPEEFNSTDYMGSEGSANHRDFNKYLNTIHWHDYWLGQMMQQFDDLGISNETLVVFAGDHGQAFKEDDGKQGTYENGHISNFRIPITFRHPHLPRYQYEANATSVSILPTILDLLINTGSLNTKDTAIASDLIQDYEGQSLIRPYRTSHNGRRAWNFGVVNSGGGMLTVTSADAPWRLIMPLDKERAWQLTDIKNDPLELDPVSKWSTNRFLDGVENKFGKDAAQWANEARVVSQWWGLERKRLWQYQSRSEDD